MKNVLKTVNKEITYFFIIGSVLFLSACKTNSSSNSVLDKTYEGNGDDLPKVTQVMVPPPMLPKFDQVENGGPKVILVTFTVEEKKIEVAPNDSIWAFTYNGTVPGPMIVAHQGDFVELTLKNPATNTQMHNIDFHAATGAMGGGDVSLVNPGQEVTFRFRCTRAGVFVYHCAPGGLMVPIHVTAGMNGAIMVLPKDGLKDENGNPVTFDRAYYIAQQDFYFPKDKDGKTENFATVQQSIQALGESIKTLKPTNIVFNGKQGALLGPNALKAKVGEKVLFITSDANNDTRMHLIGGHADLYWPGGKFSNKPFTDFETWEVPGGSAAAVLYRFREPGTYALLDHNLIEAFAYGAVAQVKVEGKWDSSLMKVVRKQSPLQ
ncbi:nitrite reductase, copper-containing [Ginsengibacter hankyongi]|uniref:Copper-containing nitrite reductase n=1 Tax=Ginsengibacter hankyongi TaxID=2607284 RepID=A0A5J5IIC4_9BACT|nr:copper-containing nitrite reductase [Ginsengibacter hankyongi]KAA9037999.1 nitrite reductase, copper-containing [Ginsengibacter hankyongi]